MRNILLRSANANNAKPYFFLNEMNKNDLPAMYSIAFWCLFRTKDSLFHSARA